MQQSRTQFDNERSSQKKNIQDIEKEIRKKLPTRGGAKRKGQGSIEKREATGWSGKNTKRGCMEGAQVTIDSNTSYKDDAGTRSIEIPIYLPSEEDAKDQEEPLIRWRNKKAVLGICSTESSKQNSCKEANGKATQTWQGAYYRSAIYKSKQNWLHKMQMKYRSTKRLVSQHAGMT